MTALPKDPTPPRLSVSLLAPTDQLERASTLELLLSVRNRFQLAFAAYASERCWPTPAFEVELLESEDSDWGYSAHLSGELARGDLKPGKLLAIGEPEGLDSLLGLETLDPFMGLPAKWIAVTQRQRARGMAFTALGGSLFDESTLVVAHTLQALGDRWAESFGLPQVVDWLSVVSPHHRELFDSTFRQNQGLFLEILKGLVDDDLWLPPPAHYLELFAAKLTLASDDPWMLSELIRAEVLPRNLPRYRDARGTLWAVEWRADPEQEEDCSARLMLRLGHALERIPPHDGTPLLLTDLPSRRSLGRALRHAFPGLPVLSWDELEMSTQLSVVAVVDARLEFDPSPWPGQLYEVTF